ncbi:unnamed protein product [Schistocephalus solidus]|uniref:Transpeptidase domain-containing protein n=1 Tax=Schistocephalus solidus TaxID=70667 RepID=A0A183TBE4_SCHSO|nr:unnamed protein product [Schistocephalus solidus]
MNQFASTVDVNETEARVGGNWDGQKYQAERGLELVYVPSDRRLLANAMIRSVIPESVGPSTTAAVLARCGQHTGDGFPVHSQYKLCA